MPANYKVSSWTTEREREREYTTVSGEKCMVRDLEMEDLIELEILNEMDSLTTLVQEQHIDRVAGKKTSKKALEKAAQEAREAERRNMMSLMKDTEKWSKISSVLDKIVTHCVLSPQLLDPWILDPNNASPKNPTGRRKLTKNERVPGEAYLDYIDLRDKIGIFGEVFHSMEDLEKFRDESTEDLGDMEDEPESEHDSGESSGN
jgi:hypothetical protein